jgi:hypothetical protein
MAYSILLVFDVRDIWLSKDPRESDLWQDAVTKLANLSQHSKAIQRLGDNVLLLPLDAGLQGIYDVVRILHNQKYRYAILSEDIEWHDGGPE